MARTQTQIATDLITSILSSTNKVTNFNVGSVVRSLIDAFSAEAAQMEQEIEDQVSNAILNSVYKWLNIPQVGAVGSTYQLAFTLDASIPQPVTLAAGTLVTIPNSTLQWEIGEDITIQPGQTVYVTATCTTTGRITNVPANTITQLVNPVYGLSVTNPSAQPIVQGRDPETQVELQAQLANKINYLHKGDTFAIEAAALTAQLTDAAGNPIEQVVKALCLDGNMPGTAYCYVFNGVGAMSQQLLQQTQDVINGYIDTDGTLQVGAKAAGVIMTVKDAPRTTVNVAVEVLPRYGYSLSTIKPTVAEAIRDFFDGLDLESPFSRSKLTYAILSKPGVADARVDLPLDDLPATFYVNPPQTPPLLTAVTTTPSTLFTAGTYSVAYTFTNEWGETPPTIANTVTLKAGQAIQVAQISLPIGATGVNYYISEAGGNTLYLAASGDGSQITITTPPQTTAPQPPTTNTAIVHGNAYVPGSIQIIELTP